MPCAGPHTGGGTQQDAICTQQDSGERQGSAQDDRLQPELRPRRLQVVPFDCTTIRLAVQAALHTGDVTGDADVWLTAFACPQIGGLHTNLAFLRRVVAHPAFAAGEVDTSFITKHKADLLGALPPPAAIAVLAPALLHSWLTAQVTTVQSPPPLWVSYTAQHEQAEELMHCQHRR